METTQDSENRPRVGHMCLVDFQHELGQALGGNVVFPDVDDLKQNRPCWDECGIVEVEITLRRVVKDPDYSRLLREAEDAR